MNKKEKYIARDIKIIEAHRRIVLKRADGWYMQQHTNIAAGHDHAIWGLRVSALEIEGLELAFAIAPIFKCKVYSFKP